uniref:Uncharacterized protein n=1 Tax=Oryza sativa subsp. japonica TaxID=39947 RepID=Q8GVP3_ORYSJ|nr:hypothetical protein [Oryza sativa Japonica Group]
MARTENEAYLGTAYRSLTWDHQVEERGGRRRRRRCAERERGRSMAEKDGEIIGRAGLGRKGLPSQSPLNFIGPG